MVHCSVVLSNSSPTNSAKFPLERFDADGFTAILSALAIVHDFSYRPKVLVLDEPAAAKVKLISSLLNQISLPNGLVVFSVSSAVWRSN